MRLGIYGGSFDPVHYGHLLLAESCREQLALDAVWFLPAAVPPHKQQRQLATAGTRIEMLELAIGGHEAFAVCTYEIDRGGVSYTVDTLAHLRQEDPTRELFFLMGADSLGDLPTWREPARICELAVPVVVDRRGASVGGEGDMFSVLGDVVDAKRLETIRQHLVRMPRIDLSSSEIRRRVAAGESVRYRTPRAVEKYIGAQKLYRGESTAGNG
ncbi:MAG: nicotinate-nucleotide adenylyltransferase [Planctomycetota bacterium]|nr:MAG: nicotinate-nucleotide adenylyltransferase [Planctomycetota bacterium]